MIIYSGATAAAVKIAVEVAVAFAAELNFTLKHDHKTTVILLT